MFILYPNHMFHRIYDIPVEFFKEKGITTLLLDVDNTLTTDNNPKPHDEVMQWLDTQHAAGMRLMILSNNLEKRVKPFSELLGLEFIAEARKPFAGKLKKALSQMDVKLSEVAVIGDQLFTDILCGRLAGCTTVLVEPMEREPELFYRLKRCLEAPVLKRFRKRGMQP